MQLGEQILMEEQTLAGGVDGLYTGNIGMETTGKPIGER